MRHRRSVRQTEKGRETNFHCNCNCNSTLKFDFDSDSEHTKAKGSLGQKVGVAAPNAIANITFLEDRADGKDYSEQQWQLQRQRTDTGCDSDSDPCLAGAGAREAPLLRLLCMEMLSLVLISTNLIKQIEFNKVSFSWLQPEQMLPNSSAAFIL